MHRSICRQTIRRLPRTLALTLAVLATLASPLLTGNPLAAPRREASRIAAGPREISEDERAIVPDRERGFEQAVILLEETEQNDSDSRGETRYHLRAKILSNEGRRLADVVIPLYGSQGKLLEWWGFTVSPEGGVHELPESALVEQELASGSRRKLRALKAALPGVVPGSIIDFGYEIRGGFGTGGPRTNIQQAWPVLEFRYLWTPTPFLTSAYQLLNTRELSVEAKRDSKTLVVHGTDIPPLIEEPLMPPDDQVRASLLTYYILGRRTGDHYWDDVAWGLEEYLDFLLRRKGPFRKALDSIEFPPGEQDLMNRVGIVYDWVVRNIRNTSHMMAEDLETQDVSQSALLSFGRVLDRKEGNDFQILLLFAGLARTLGAEAHLVMAPDRTDHYWNRAYLSTRQFDEVLVAVRDPKSADRGSTLAAPNSGLPFGEIPWWVTGVTGMIATKKGAEVIALPPSEFRKNVLDSKVSIGFETESEMMDASWTRRARGQCGLAEREALRSQSPAERRDSADRMCGAGGDLELTESSTPDLDDRSGLFQLRCAGRLPGAAIPGEVNDFRFSFYGPWIEPLPELTAVERTHPVILEYPRLEISFIDVATPEGFVPTDAPEGIEEDGPYGRYQLTITRTDEGYHLERMLTLLPLRVDPEDYPGLREFLVSIQRADNTFLIFHRKGEEAAVKEESTAATENGKVAAAKEEAKKEGAQEENE